MLSSEGHLALAIRALVFTLILNCSGIYAFFDTAHEPRFVLNGIDEIVYLRRAVDIGKGRSPDAYYYEHDRPVSALDVVLHEPSGITDLIVGSIANLLGLGSFALGFVLDLLCGFLTYFVATCFFRLLAPDKVSAEIATIAALILPWSFSLDQYFQTQIPWAHVTTSKIGHTFGLPVLRGVYAQLSYPFYFAALFCLIKAYEEKETRHRFLCLTGLFGGALSAIYFFAWGAYLLVAMGYFLARGLWSQQLRFARLKELGTIAPYWGLPCLTASVPGLLSFASAGGFDRSGPHPEFSEYWYFSFELFVQVVLALGTVLVFRFNQRVRQTLVFCAVFFVAQFFVMNLQPSFGTMLSPYRFVQLYYQPVVAGLLCLLLATILRLGNSKTPWFLFVSGIFVWCGLNRFSEFDRFLISRHQISPLQELIAAVQRSTEDDAVVAQMTYKFPFRRDIPRFYAWRPETNYISSATNRYTLQQNWILSRAMPLGETLERERFTGWLYSGVPQLLWPCPQGIMLPGDLYWMTWTALQIYRREECSRSPQYLEQDTVCKMLHTYKLDYFIWERQFGFRLPAVVSSVSRALWTSDDGSVVLFKFFQNIAQEELCTQFSADEPRLRH